MAVEYKGDVTEQGEVAPLRFQARDGIDPEAIRQLSSTPGLVQVDEANDAQVILFRSKTTLTTPEALEQFPELMAGYRIGVGMSNVSHQLVAASGIFVDATPGPSSVPVAIRALTLILASAARVVPSTNALREGKWLKGRPEVEPQSIHKSNLGIIGMGRIGSQLRGFGEGIFKDVKFFDLRDLEGKESSVESLIHQSDYIVLAVDLQKPQVVFPAELVDRMKPGATLVNISRGEYVDEAALVERMGNTDAPIFYASDVYSCEKAPGMFDSEVLAAMFASDHFTGTHHTGAQDPGTKKDLGLEGVRKLLTYAQNGVINPDGDRRVVLPKPFLLGKEKEQPGARFLVTHKSVVGAGIGVLQPATEMKLSFSSFHNEEGIPLNGNGDHFAVTAFDVDGTTPEEAAEVLKRIRQLEEVFRARALFYGLPVPK